MRQTSRRPPVNFGRSQDSPQRVRRTDHRLGFPQHWAVLGKNLPRPPPPPDPTPAQTPRGCDQPPVSGPSGGVGLVDHFRVGGGVESGEGTAPGSAGHSLGIGLGYEGTSTTLLARRNSSCFDTVGAGVGGGDQTGRGRGIAGLEGARGVFSERLEEVQVRAWGRERELRPPTSSGETPFGVPIR